MMWPDVPFETLYAVPSRNGVYKPKEYHGRGCRIVNMGELFGFDYLSNQEMNRLELNEAELTINSLENGDLLFGRRSLVEAGAGKCSLVVDLAEPLTFESSIIRVRIEKKAANPWFLYHYFRSPQGRGRIRSIVSGTTVKGIRASDLKRISVANPPLVIQDKIASILTTYDDLIENNRRRMALLEDAARQLYQEWFVRLRFPGYEHTRIVDGVPEGWEKCRISDFGDVVTGKTPSTKEEDNYNGDIQFIKTPDMHGNVYVIQTESYLTEKGSNSQTGKFLPAGSILVSCIGTVGVVSLTSERCQFNQQINAVIPNEDYLRHYGYFALKDLKPRLDAIGGGVTMANVSKGKFENMDISRPATTILRNFDEICRSMFKQIQTLALQNQKLRTARDLLLPKLMSGEIAV